jgi:hypothetical protein
MGDVPRPDPGREIQKLNKSSTVIGVVALVVAIAALVVAIVK